MGLGGIDSKNRRTLRSKPILTPFLSGIESFLPGQAPFLKKCSILRKTASRCPITDEIGLAGCEV
jgi:hypothetical protein